MGEQLLWKNFFYSTSDRVQDAHSEWIHPTNIKNNNDKDIKHFKNLVEQCFNSHMSYMPQKLTIEDIQLLQNKGISFFEQRKITDLFMTKYYRYPGLQKHHKIDISKIEENISPDESVEELIEHLSADNSIAVIIGEVGVGKSALLSKFSLDIRASNDYSRYLPVTINIQTYNDIFKGANDEIDFDVFWLKVIQDIISYLEKNSDQISSINQNSTDEKVEENVTYKSIIENLKNIRTGKGNQLSEKPISQVDLFSQLNQVMQDLNSIDKRIILIFDNLDTLCYENERYMFFPKGYDQLVSRIELIKKIIWGVTNKLNDSCSSFIFSVRPYVFSHVFKGETEQSMDNSAISVYSLCDTKPEVPMKQRLQLLNDLMGKIDKSTDVLEGKKNELKENIEKFQSIVSECLERKEKPFDKLYKISNQGFRSIVKFYQGLDFHPSLFHRYFSHDIVYLYILSMRQLYSQVKPNGYRLNDVSHFPNIFLIRCNNYFNKNFEEAAKPHGPIYWLKFLILMVCIKEDRISISKLSKIFSDYEDQAVKLSLGSLCTVNESNCLSLIVNEEGGNFDVFQRTSHVTHTKRGLFLVDKFYCLGLECLQVYFDDWLFSFPKLEEELLPSSVISILGKNYDENNYKYLLDADESEHQKRRKKTIFRKSRQSILLLSILKHAKVFEMRKYPGTWKLINEMFEDHEFTKSDFFDIRKDKIIEDSCRAMGKHDLLFKEELMNFNNELNKCDPILNTFFGNINGVLY